MKLSSPDVKMQVLGALEGAPRHSHDARIQIVADTTFADEQRKNGGRQQPTKTP